MNPISAKMNLWKRSTYQMTTITMAFNYLNALGIDKALIDEQAVLSDQEQFKLDVAKFPLHLFVSQLGSGFDPRKKLLLFWWSVLGGRDRKNTQYPINCFGCYGNITKRDLSVIVVCTGNWLNIKRFKSITSECFRPKQTRLISTVFNESWCFDNSM